jgi:thiamine-phosphate pyrophosphorylase
MALVETAEAGLRAAAAGATVVRLRAPGRPVRELEEEAERLVRECPVPVLVTGRVDLALAVGAAGVHLPEGDLDVASARRLGPELVVGRSIHSAAAAAALQPDAPDYLLLGPVWATPSHPDAPGLGLDALRAAALAARPAPVLAVGGIDEARTERVMRAGAAGWAAIRMYL